MAPLPPTPSPRNTSRPSTPRSATRLSSPNKSSRNNDTKEKKAAIIIKYLFLAILILLVYFLLRINLQLIQRLDGGHPEVVTTKNKSNAAIVKQQIAPQKIDKENEALQNRLVALRNEVTSMQKKVDDLKLRMEHVKSIQRSSSATAILGGGGLRSTTNKHTPNSNNNIINELNRHTCTPEQQKQQSKRLKSRFSEWWSHSACPDQLWMQGIDQLFELVSQNHHQSKQQPYVVLDIGCNKGYTSADFLDALSPGTNMNPHTLVTAIRAIAQEDNTKFDRDGGVCNDSKKPLNEDRKTVREVEVHCFEPSPATFEMLKRAHTKLMPGDDDSGGGAKWLIHNKGLHNMNGEMKWHSACAHAVGDELCTIVEEGTADAITVPVVTVDKFLEETYPSSSEETMSPIIHMLKIDAEGLDPAVLEGSIDVLTKNRAVMVMFEFNPRLSEKGDHPHGMWGKGGNPRVTLMQVTDWLDEIGYDCYLDTHLPDEKEKSKGVLEAPGLYRITGGCMTEEPNVRGWANVVCASRKYPIVAERLLGLATIVQT